MKNFKRVLVVGEKNVFSGLAEILELDLQANEVMSRMLSEGYKGVNLAESKQTIQSLSKQSAEAAFKVSVEITSGAVSPNVLDDLIASVNRAEDILNHYYALSRELSRMSKVDLFTDDLSYDTEWKPVMEKLSDAANKAISKVKALLAASDLDSMVASRKEILALRETGDDVKNSGFDKLYCDSPKLKYVEFIYYAELLHRHEYILEDCKDLSNLVVSIVNSIVK